MVILIKFSICMNYDKNILYSLYVYIIIRKERSIIGYRAVFSDSLKLAYVSNKATKVVNVDNIFVKNL